MLQAPTHQLGGRSRPGLKLDSYQGFVLNEKFCYKRSMMQTQITIETNRRGLHLITDQVLEALGSGLPASGVLNCFIQHTSASLIIQENADPSAREDLEEFLNRLAPEGESWHRHTLEGPDDTTSHLKASITQTSLNIPIVNGRLGLGTWQGIYLWEHRTSPHRRKIVLTVMG